MQKLAFYLSLCADERRRSKAATTIGGNEAAKLVFHVATKMKADDGTDTHSSQILLDPRY
jgi:hypothetical protein